MSAIDLIILGFLKKRPMSAYEITQYFKFKRVQKWVKVGSPTIYQNIKKLAARNHLSSKSVKQGEMPEKAIYSLTQKGEKYFFALMDQYSTEPGNIYFDFNAFIVNLGLLDNEIAVNMLKNLKLNFIASQDDVNNDQAELSDLPVEGVAIINLYRTLFKDLIQWADDLIGHYETKT